LSPTIVQRPLRIALNALLLSREASFRSGGISRVIHGLLRELARAPRGHRYDVFVPQSPPSMPDAGAVTFHLTGEATARPPARIAWEQSAQSVRLAALKPDLVHGLAYALPLAWYGPAVVTVYDLSFLRFPETMRRASRLYLAAITRLSSRRARRVVTISECSKRDIVRLLGVPADRVDVAYPAVDERYQPLPLETVAAFRQAKSLPETFVFSVGTLEPRKNVHGLLSAYAQLDTPRPPLYIAGGAGWRYTPIYDLVQRLRLERDVRFLGFVPEGELPLWYACARLFIFPSLFEGFGLPVLEAMASGTPVIASNAASLPEVGGKAVSLVPPNDAARLAREMQTLLASPAQRTAMRAAGRIQASRFTWAAMADQTVQCYNRVVGAA